MLHDCDVLKILIWPPVLAWKATLPQHRKGNPAPRTAVEPRGVKPQAK